MGREWDFIERRLKNTLSEYDVAFTHGPEHATLLTREALRAGWEMIVCVGGDGTLNEVVNGFYEKHDANDLFTLGPDGWIVRKDVSPELVNPDAVLGVIPRGTGGDFRRTVGLMGGWKEAIECLRGDTTRRIDLGQMAYVDHNGVLAHRFFANVASAGLSGLVDELVNSTTKINGSFSFVVGTLRAFTQWRNTEVDFRIDGVEEFTQRVLMGVVANGQYFGGGMWIAPGASVSDGLFDFVVMGDLSVTEAVRTFAQVYKGTFLREEKVSRRRARQVAMRPSAGSRVLLDADGEQPGKLPALFEMLPSAIRLKI